MVFRLLPAIALMDLSVQGVEHADADRLKQLQTAYVANATQKLPRAYHFGSQGPDDVYSNHTSHTNRLVPVYVFGRKANLSAVTGRNSRYRDPARIKELYGFLPANTVNPQAVYADQSDLYHVEKDAIASGIKHLFIVWFDGLDWPTTQAAAIARTASVYVEGKGSGLIFQDEVQERGWKVGTVTNVPFNHASPAAMYAQNVHRDDYQDIARAMVGKPGVIQEVRHVPLRPGLDVVLGTGFGVLINPSSLARQGRNGILGSLFVTDADLAAIDVRNGGRYIVVHTESGTNGSHAVKRAAHQAVKQSARLFGIFRRDGLDHLPFQTADGCYDPAPSLTSDGALCPAEWYTPADRIEQPTQAQMTDAALTVLDAGLNHPFALFIEAGDVDFALHANNLDNAIGAVYSGEEAVRTVIRWVKSHSNWDDSVLIVSADHGHYLVLDDPQALAPAR
jgi:alkaline phosphatase